MKEDRVEKRQGIGESRRSCCRRLQSSMEKSRANELRTREGRLNERQERLYLLVDKRKGQRRE